MIVRAPILLVFSFNIPPPAGQSSRRPLATVYRQWISSKKDGVMCAERERTLIV